MKLKIGLFVGFFLSLTNGLSWAEQTLTMPQLLARVAPSRNAQAILAKVDQVSPQTKKIPFPTNDPSLKILSGYSYEAVKDPAFNQAYQGMLNQAPQELHQEMIWSWVSKLQDMTASPNDYVSTPSGNLIRLWACQAHACGSSLTMLFDPNTKNLWGFLHLSEVGKPPKTYLLGNPSDDQLAFLLATVKDHLMDYAY